jgi:hypothetical protein
MRTTLDIDEDVLEAAKELRPTEKPPGVRNGVPLLPPRPGSRPVTMEEVNRLRDEVG